MSKAAGSKSRSQSSHSRSRSRSRSRSFTRSRSRSRSRSHSRKRKYSPRSRSRSYSPTHNRERNYPREYQPREFRGHRGYRRPFIQRRGRGYYPRGNWNNRGGYGNYGNYNHYGNYRPNWHNYRSTYSPRRGRSRSRSPKRRSASPRSRSRSRYTDKSSSSRSGRSSSSRSRSSPHRSRSASPKRRSKKTKSSQKEAAASKPPTQETEDQQKRAPQDEQGGNGGEALAGLAPKRSDSWKGLTAYDTSPKHPSPAPRSTVVLKTSPALHSSPSQQSPSLSGTARHTSPHGSPAQMSPQSRSPNRPNASHQSPPSLSSTIRSVPRQAPANHSPPLVGLAQGNAQKEETRPGMSTLFADQPVPTISSYLKSVVKTEFHVKNVPEKGSRSSQSPKLFKGGVAEEFEKISKAEMRHKFGYDEEEVEEHDKDYAAKNQKEYGYEDELKYRSKLIASKTQERYDQEDEEEEDDDDHDRPRKREEINFFKHITISKEKFREVEEDELMPERFKKEERFQSKKADGSRYREVSPVKASKYKAGRAESPPPPRKSSDGKEQEGVTAQDENAPVLKPAHRPTEVTLKMDSLQFGDDTLGSTNVLTHERRLCRDLVHKPKKDQEFRSIFQHIQMAQSRRSPSELFAQHIVTLVHHVKEHYFKSAGVTLNERFTMYQRRTAEQEVPRQKSPEIHRRIDISPSALKKRMHSRDEIKGQKESSYKGEGKLKDEPDDLRLDIEHRRKYKSKEGEHKKDSSKDSRDSSHSRERSKEKSGKIPKAYKESKKQRKRKKVRARTSSSSSSSSSSSPSHEGKEEPEEGVGREETTTGFNKARLGTREFTGPPARGRARGIFQFRIRGRGYGRGAFPGPSNSSNPGNPTFQKRPREEDWDPEYTPKSKKYYLHDDREGDGDNYWANKRGRGTFQRGRGRFLYKKSNTSPKWTHDKYQGSGQEGVEEEEEEEEEDGQVGSITTQEEKKLGTMEQ
ncbi:thyroid hormone receptor-associated protein 3-like isoform X2 [Scyliorhinus canicula]|uniref:thyroid hormone receptor-associated protein 3-like isoform X2 n=1 Tax=Scyliorhinus canicula TaxID=7830 RepID=UPI0018F7CFE6|nr:thyroid hormone receptor-associated protein 3-like isoform X2 [Scyliorhinus canicula]